MQDRFKFRFFDKDKKIMIKPPDEMSDSEWRRCCNVYGYDEWYFSIELALTKVLDYFDDTSFELMQSTGLKDKNGKLIYEGDIVSVKVEIQDFFGEDEYCSINYKGEIIFEKGEIAIDVIDTTKHPISLYHHAKNCEVIGNIYENPELLKGGE